MAEPRDCVGISVQAKQSETRHRWIPSAAMAFVSMKSDFVDPKGHLTHFCQKYCKRPLHHADVEYLTYELGEQYQAIVILNCIKGNVFPGSICSNQRDAEWSAAKQALKAFASLTEMVLLPQVQEALQTRHQGRNRWQAFAPYKRDICRGDACTYIHEASVEAFESETVIYPAAKDWPVHETEPEHANSETPQATPTYSEDAPTQPTKLTEGTPAAVRVPTDWTVEDVLTWIKEVKCGAFATYADLFGGHKIDGVALSAQTASTLKEIGIVPLGPRKVLAAQIEKLFQWGCGQRWWRTTGSQHLVGFDSLTAFDTRTQDLGQDWKSIKTGRCISQSRISYYCSLFSCLRC